MRPAERKPEWAIVGMRGGMVRNQVTSTDALGPALSWEDTLSKGSVLFSLEKWFSHFIANVNHLNSFKTIPRSPKHPIAMTSGSSPGFRSAQTSQRIPACPKVKVHVLK